MRLGRLAGELQESWGVHFPVLGAVPKEARGGGRAPGLELKAVVNHHEGAGNQTQVVSKSSQVLSAAEPSLQPSPRTHPTG